MELKGISNLEKVAAGEFYDHDLSTQSIHQQNLERVARLKTLPNDEAAKELDALVSELSFFDSKTGLFNEKYFHLLLDRHFMRLNRGSGKKLDALTVAELDINKFKNLNDLLGYDVGNEGIEAFAEITKLATRNTDYQFRLHGDEHAIVFEEGTGIEEAVVATRRVQELMTELLPIKLEGLLQGYPERYERYKKEFQGKLTVSAGIAQITPAVDHNKGLFLERLDQALHRAKTDPRDNHIGISVYDPRSRPEPFLVMVRA